MEANKAERGRDGDGSHVESPFSFSGGRRLVRITVCSGAATNPYSSRTETTAAGTERRRPRALATVPISVTGLISSRIEVCASPGANVVWSELSTPVSLVLVVIPDSRGLRLHANELEPEIAQPVEESEKL